ncbi:protein disulfide isomerase pTAC5, chloroplastic isoform X2 [Juglans microcarpa x Juglans regia]|uniref:protein disulfide isomerase pTAC5, chloroplastic isoform X2 n=1 Tax=Juglans microcarpa x Juglans regia TaxID=2249226 RepID=UPI001B7E942C|nr:protein disulfide isomerase pTAC5, chloroplastic isoform X2 [Juglans microcarpa x Juglans regia]
MYSSLSLPLNPSLHFKPFALPHTTLLLPFPKLSSLSPFKSHVCRSTNHSDYDREEIRWLREEQRWLREEQRWLREERRWAGERDSLLCQIAELKLRIQHLEHQNSTLGGGASVSETISSIAGLLQVLKEKGLIAESSSSASPMVLLEKEDLKEKEEVVVVDKEVVRVSEDVAKKTRKTLRKGSEGDEVRALQEALQKLGFYSGEEDMEYSSFSSGTERAVKTWQSTLGATEDGIMTAELLERLFTEQQIVGARSNTDADQKDSNVSVSPKVGANGAPVAAITEVSEFQQKVVNEESVTEVEVSQHRVFLLGENRWEEPSRIARRNKQVGNSKTKDATTKCLTCRGEGRLLCTECDGTGEPNIEPQFLEWVDEGMKCPYCEGVGFTVCDVCEGKRHT